MTRWVAGAARGTATGTGRGAESGRSPRPGAERGAGTVLLLGVAAVVLLCFVGLAALGGAQHARARAQTAADLAALGGAGAHRAGLDGCAVARETVARNAGALTGCELGDGGTVTVTVAVDTADTAGPGVPGRATARARAGPDPDPHDGTAEEEPG